MAVVAGGRDARTRYEILRRFGSPHPCSLLECRLETGRTHQIRVHLQAVGHPILGDEVYGRGKRLFLSRIKPDYRYRQDREERPLTPTLALHAWKLSLVHPATGETVGIEAPWPHDLEVAVKYLRRYAMAGEGVAAPDPLDITPDSGGDEGDAPMADPADAPT